MTRAPAKNPCGSCPYRRDVPPGVWDVSEYVKLPRYDAPATMDQPFQAFSCHQGNGRLCSGWVAVHDMTQSLGFRMIARDMSDEDIEATLDYTTEVPLFSSGAEAAEHGLSRLADPPPEAQRVMAKVTRRRARRP